MSMRENRSARARGRVPADLSNELRPQNALRSLLAGLLLYVLEFILLVSFAALIFSAQAQSLVPFGLGMMLVGNAVFMVVLSFTSSYRGSVGVAQESPIAVLAALVATAQAGLPPGTTDEQRLATLVMLIVVTSVATGLVFMLLGRFRLGSLVRFLPYPVMGGFLAGTGVLLLEGAIGLMTGAEFGRAVFEPGQLIRWLPGILFGVALLLVLQRSRSPLALPAAIVAMTALFYLIAWLGGGSAAELQVDGWLLGQFPTNGIWRFPLAPSMVDGVDWGLIIRSLPGVIPVVIVGVIALLLNANGLELSIQRDMDLNRELVSTGAANIAGGILGGLVGFLSISLSTLNTQVSGGRRLPSMIVAALLLVTTFVGPLFLGYVPLVVLGGLLAYLGLVFLHRWIYQSWSTLLPVDFAVLLFITAAIVWEGFLVGVAAGLFATVAIFVVSYSRSSVVKHALTGTTFKSRVTRSPGERAALAAVGEQLYILQLQGYIFFGTANGLYEQVRARVQAATTRYLVLDFRQVGGLDSTALLSFDKIRRLAETRGFVLVLTDVNERIRRQLGRAGLSEAAGAVRFLPDIDRGVEWCEEALWASSPLGRDERATLADYLGQIAPREVVTRLIGTMERATVSPGDHIVRQGEEPDSLFFIESGQVTAQLESPGREPLRLETMRGGRTVGELGFYLGTRRSAAVVADEPTVIYRLSRARLDELEQDDPEAASALHRVIVHLLGERVLHLMRAVDALQA